MESIDVKKETSKEKIRKAIDAKIKEIKGYTPKIGIWGSTGVGKSSLCNALFGRDIAKVSHVAAGTREIQEIYLAPINNDEGGVIIVDFPGIAETVARNEEYLNLYKEKVNELDVVVWVVKSDERQYAESQIAYQSILEPNIKNCPVIFAISAIEKIEPMEDDEGERYWDKKENKPAGIQLASMNEKIIEISKAFDIPTKNIIATSSKKNYNISEAMELIIDIIPNEKKYAFYREAGENVKTENMAEKAEKGVWDSVKEWAGEAWDAVKDVAVEVVSAALIAVGSKLLSKIKFW
ncbi:GTPase family protein [Pseudescherichia vulneris]|uniref:GTPase family protein n=1 Tax=Pseudescherichia vulneris TaxID=566 RepID=UPI0028A76E4D|nr:GTPase [Pseudescherichia vulneris]